MWRDDLLQGPQAGGLIEGHDDEAGSLTEARFASAGLDSLIGGVKWKRETD